MRSPIETRKVNSPISSMIEPWILPRDGGLIPSSVTICPHGGKVYAADLESVLNRVWVRISLRVQNLIYL